MRSVLCVAVASALVVASLLPCSAAACTSGILQLKPSPKVVRDDQLAFNDCLWLPPSPNSIKAACGVTLKVAVAKGVVKVTPVSRETYTTYTGPTNVANKAFSCKDMNGTGVFLRGSTTDARITLYDNIGGPLTTLTKTGPNQITLSPGKIHVDPAYSAFQCRFDYTVISGCVFGIQAPAKPPACPSGYFIRAGAGGTKFCAPCPAGTSSKGPNAPFCTPCPPGTFANILGAPCRPCEVGTFARQPGSASCQPCRDDPKYPGAIYSTGKLCGRCPWGSTADRLHQGRCVKCARGRKCCTYGAGPGCPACKPGARASAATSLFALESTTPTTCLASTTALCTPTLNITIDGQCGIWLSNNGFSRANNRTLTCAWQSWWWIKGAVPSITNELSKFDNFAVGEDKFNLAYGSVTAAKAPYLEFTMPDKCKLRYRALTKPVAILLGARPLPAKAGTCPRGQYRDTTTDTKPGPCLPCRPGTYGSAAGTCTPCKPGTYAGGYGALSCAPCPEYQIAAKPGAIACTYCPAYASSQPGGQYLSNGVCKACPANTRIYYGAGGKCLGTPDGNVCCAAGDCGSDPKCKGPVPATTHGKSVLQVVATNVKDGTCKNWTYMSCLKAKDILSIRSFDGSLDMTKIGPLCPGLAAPQLYFGAMLGATRGYLGGYFTTGITNSDAYELLSDSTKGTITMYAAPFYPFGDVPITPAYNPACFITLKLVAGHAFDLRAPAGTKCPPGMTTDTSTSGNGVTYCDYCDAGQYLSGARCLECAKGTYSSYYGATKCEPCPPGFFCGGANFPSGSSFPCPPGTYADKSRQQAPCKTCPRNTYSNKPEGATRCLPCPKGQTSPPGSVACNLPF